jgi:hypothetical protein
MEAGLTVRHRSTVALYMYQLRAVKGIQHALDQADLVPLSAGQADALPSSRKLSKDTYCPHEPVPKPTKPVDGTDP